MFQSNHVVVAAAMIDAAAQVSGLAKDLHSGKFGGAVHEPMVDLIQVVLEAYAIYSA